MNVTGEWVILGHGRPDRDFYMGPGAYAEIEESCHSWNEVQTARESRGEAPRGSIQRFFIRRVG